MVGNRRTLRGGQGSPRCLGVVAGFVLKLIRESTGLTQIGLAEQCGVDVASVQGWESGRRPLAALRTADLIRLRFKLARRGAKLSTLAVLENAIEADLIITDAVQAGGHLIEADEHPLGATVHQRKLTNLMTWPFTGILPAQLGDLPELVRARRGPVPDQPTLSQEARARFFDHLLVTADANGGEDAALLRRQAIYLLGFDSRASTADWLHAEQLRALRDAGRTDHVPSWVAVRSSAVALANTGNRDPLQAFVQQALATDQQERANLNYWAYWAGEIDSIQIDDAFMTRIDPRSWTGRRLLGHLLQRLLPGSRHTELNIHKVWALLLAHPTLLTNHPALRSETAKQGRKPHCGSRSQRVGPARAVGHRLRRPARGPVGRVAVVEQPADQHAVAFASFAFELGVLKRVRRAGWWHAGVRDPESVAEHSLRVAQLASLIAAIEGAEPGRAALLATWHDSQETRTGDIPHTARPYLTKPSPETITADQTAALPDAARKTVREAVIEYEAQQTPEAHCAKDADKLECLIQAIEYRDAGYAKVQGWIDSSREGLRTDTARRIADAALHTSTLGWRSR